MSWNVSGATSLSLSPGIGTVVALMLPYALVITVAWVLFFILWFVLGIPLGPGYPVIAP